MSRPVDARGPLVDYVRELAGRFEADARCLLEENPVALARRRWELTEHGHALDLLATATRDAAQDHPAVRTLIRHHECIGRHEYAPGARVTAYLEALIPDKADVLWATEALDGWARAACLEMGEDA